MPMFLLQSAILILIAFILGCIIGCLLRRLFGSADTGVAAAAIGTAAVGTAAIAAKKPAPAKPAVPAAKIAAVPPAKPVAPKPAPAAKIVAVPPAKPAAPKPAPAAKIAAVPPAKPKPAAKPKVAKPKASKPKAAAKPAKKDDLKRIRGIGPQNEARLNAVGTTLFAQIADWSAKDQKDMGERLAFPGRIEREEWVSQAKVLAKGGNTNFSKRVAKGEVKTSIGKGSVGELGTKPSTMRAARGGTADNLTLINGVGNAIEEKLFDLGIYHFDQMAKWSPAHEAWVSIAVGFPGRSQRENWVGEAKIFASGGTTEHAKKVERGEITTSRKSTPGEKK